MTTTAYLNGQPVSITLNQLVGDKGENYELITGKDKYGADIYAKASLDQIKRFTALRDGGKEAEGGFVPTSSNTSLAYTDPISGTIAKLNEKNIVQYANSSNKSQIRFFTGNLVVSGTAKEKRQSVGGSYLDVLKGGTIETEVERTFALPGNWSGAERKSSVGIDNADNKILFGDPTQKTRSSKFEGFNFGNSSNQQ